MAGGPRRTGRTGEVFQRLDDGVGERLAIGGHQDGEQGQPERQFVKLVAEPIKCVGGTPGIGRCFGTVVGAVVDFLHAGDRTFRDGAFRSQHGEHRIPLAFAPILAKHDSSSPAEPNDSSWRQKRQARCNFRWFGAIGWMACMTVSSRMVEGVPLGDPVRTDARAERFHLDMEGVELLLENLGPLIQLKLGKTLGQDPLNVLMGMGFQEIQDHRIADRKLAVDGFRVSGQPLGQDRQIDIGRRSDHGKSDMVFPSASGSPSNLLDFAGRQVGEVAGLADAGLRDHDRACWKVDTCR